MIRNYISQKNGMLALALGLLFASCSKDNVGPEDENNNGKPEVVAVKDLNGLAKGYACFSLTQRKEVEESSGDWDIKISGTAISFGNGAGGQLVEGVFNSYATAPETGYGTSAITGNGSYYVNTLFTEPMHAILMKPGILLIVKTGKGEYAKIEMISYYKGNPDITTAEFANLDTRPEKQNYTFNYVLQTNGSNKF